MKLAKVALVGRTNVGKSTIFNKLVEKPAALVSPIAGTTRDRNIHPCFWNGKTFLLTDTGGLDIAYLPESRTPKNLLKKISASSLEEKIIAQTQYAVNESDMIILVLDSETGVLPEDRTILNFLRKNKKPFVIAINKVDRPRSFHEASEFFPGEKEQYLVSGASGFGLGDLLDAVVSKIPASFDESERDAEITAAIVGRPNVGKSSLLNALVGDERAIVSEIPHTTRESHDTVTIFRNHAIRFVDTAGMRKKARVKDKLEAGGTARTMTAIDKADIVLFVFAVNEPLGSQDAKILQYIVKKRKSVILVANKWDMVPEKHTRIQDSMKKEIQKYFPYLAWVPILFISAKNVKKPEALFNLLLEVAMYRNLQINDAALKEFLHRAVRRHPILKRKTSKHAKFLSLTQDDTNPPRFTLVVDNRKNVHSASIRFLQNQLYDSFNFLGTPLDIEIINRQF